MKDNLLKDKFPELIKEWDFEHNKHIDLDTITYGSGQKARWVCPQGHRYTARIFSRTLESSGKSGCPYCSHNQPTTQEHNFASMYPELLKEWDYSKNKVNPQAVSPKSSRSYWWKCKCGNSWETRVAHRVNGSKCPKCHKQRNINPTISLATQNPNLAKEWDYKLNALTPNDYSPYSHKLAHWICPNGHPYEAIIANRNQNGTGCPHCSHHSSLTYSSNKIDNFIHKPRKSRRKADVEARLNLQ